MGNRTISAPDPDSRTPIPKLMGIVNTTPDSFYDGGKFNGATAALSHAKKLISQGADIIDVGGESTRPGAVPVTIEEEIKRTVPVIESLRGCGKIISIDTRNAAVMRAATDAGATIINDITALTHDPAAMETVKNSNAEIILMHMQGTPQTMQINPQYTNVTEEIYAYLAERLNACVKYGIAQDKIILDPGIGFGKKLNHNLSLLQNIGRFRDLGCRILIGVSRKSFIGKLGGDIAPEDRLPGSLAAAVYAAQNGADILRVHDVAETKQALIIANALFGAN